jgi:hypothetical protein
MAQTCEINARLHFLQLFPKVNYADIVKQPGKIAKNNSKVLTGERNGGAPSTLMSLPRELRDLILDEVLRGPLTSPSTACEPANGPLQIINTTPRLKPGRIIPSISQVNAQLRAETHQRHRKLSVLSNST